MLSPDWVMPGTEKWAQVYHWYCREGWMSKKLSKSWHCQDWLDPPAPPPNLGTLVDLTTKSAKMQLTTIDDETNIFSG